MIKTLTELVSNITPIIRQEIPLTTQVIDKMLLDIDIASAIDKIERAVNSKVIYFKSIDIKDDINNIELKERFDINKYVDVFICYESNYHRIRY